MMDKSQTPTSCVAPGTGYHRVEGNRRASGKAPVSDPHPKSLSLRFATVSSLFAWRLSHRRPRERERSGWVNTWEVETPLPSNSPHDHMILRVELVTRGRGGGPLPSNHLRVRPADAIHLTSFSSPADSSILPLHRRVQKRTVVLLVMDKTGVLMS